jgi:hypothetical protein
MEKDHEISITMTDFGGRTLEIFVASSTKSAGKKAIFFVKNCVINNSN